MKVELAKREERIGSLEERITGLLKCIASLELDVMNKDKAPKERNYVSLNVNQHHLVEVKRNQDELSEVVKGCCKKINQLADYLKAFKGLETNSDNSTNGDTVETSTETRDAEKAPGNGEEKPKETNIDKKSPE